jgi:hypothetical protein
MLGRKSLELTLQGTRNACMWSLANGMPDDAKDQAVLLRIALLSILKWLL